MAVESEGAKAYNAILDASRRSLLFLMNAHTEIDKEAMIIEEE